MARSMCPDKTRATMAALETIAVLAAPVPLVQVIVIALGGLTGFSLLRADTSAQHAPFTINVRRNVAIGALVLFFVALIGLPVLAHFFPAQTILLIDSFYTTGSLVFGGGHVVLPLLQSEVVPPGWASNDAFLAGYGAAQAVPGPLFTFAAYLGTVLAPAPNGWLRGPIALVVDFVPSFLLVITTLPFWDQLRRVPSMQSALMGINAVVVGLLLAAPYSPVWTSAILSPLDFALAIGAYTLLVFWRVPPWVVVPLSALVGWAMALLVAAI